MDEETGGAKWVARDVACLRTGIANLYFVGPPGAGDRGWVLVDAGMQGFTRRIARAAEALFGPGARPAVIVLTHGHFDHVGALPTLSERWDAPVYAHRLELPYVTGRSPYPPPDPTVGGGMVARLSFLFPRGPFVVGEEVVELPADGSVPGLGEWRWIPTPGHSPGHVSLFRDADRTLIAGDAFVTTKQESALAALSEFPELHGPPAYFTIDWPSARESVERLAALEPALAVTGHGLPFAGEALRQGLHRLARDFDRIAVPKRGRYVREPAIADPQGVVRVPPPVPDPVPKIALGVAGAVALGLAWRSTRARRP